MCATCGCGDEHHHEHEHSHDHHHGHDGHDKVVSLEARVLEKNDRIAADNRAWLTVHGVAAYNLMSSPGAGKTTLLERTLRERRGRPVSVIEGDQETERDAERIRAAGARAVQINTGAGCHLDAEMLRGGLAALEPAPGSLLFIENVGNLVCPALFDLGETGRVVVMSVTEGDDKPIKYPHMFRTADLVLINKVDLLPYVDFDQERCAGQVRALNPAAAVLSLSATRGEGLGAWYAWL